MCRETVRNSPEGSSLRTKALVSVPGPALAPTVFKNSPEPQDPGGGDSLAEQYPHSPPITGPTCLTPVPAVRTETISKEQRQGTPRHLRAWARKEPKGPWSCLEWEDRVYQPLPHEAVGTKA